MDEHIVGIELSSIGPFVNMLNLWEIMNPTPDTRFLVLVHDNGGGE